MRPCGRGRRAWYCSTRTEPDGYVRTWSPPGFPPMRHIGYAVQWFALALALLVIYLVTNLRQGRHEPAQRS